MESIYNGGSYHYYYTTLVGDVNSFANARMGEFSQAWLPTTYFDGGIYNLVGTGTSGLQTRIAQAGALDVPELYHFSVAVEWMGSNTLQIIIQIQNGNATPYIPATPTGPATGDQGTEYSFESVASDLDNDQLYYMWDWGDGSPLVWDGPYDSDTPQSLGHTWSTGGMFDVKVKAKDTNDLESDWSEVASIDITAIYICGDADGSDAIDISDAVFLINFIFGGGPAPDPLEAGDADCSGANDISDAVYLINFIFGGGPAPCSTCP